MCAGEVPALGAGDGAFAVDAAEGFGGRGVQARGFLVEHAHGVEEACVGVGGNGGVRGIEDGACVAAGEKVEGGADAVEGDVGDKGPVHLVRVGEGAVAGAEGYLAERAGGGEGGEGGSEGALLVFEVWAARVGEVAVVVLDLGKEGVDRFQVAVKTVFLVLEVCERRLRYHIGFVIQQTVDDTPVRNRPSCAVFEKVMTCEPVKMPVVVLVLADLDKPAE